MEEQARDLLALGYRQRRIVVVSFLTVSMAALLFALTRPAQYEAQMKILVKRERIDPVVTSDESSQRWPGQTITEEDLNSEVELLKSRDLLSRVVLATGLHERSGGLRARLKRVLWTTVEAGSDATSLATNRRVAKAVRAVEQNLEVQPLRKSSLIRATYTSSDPGLAAAVLRALADRYLEKHLMVHRPNGAFGFFENETERYRQQLASLESRLDQHGRDTGVVSVQYEKDVAIRQIGELEVGEHTSLVQIAETKERIAALQAQVEATPARTTTEIRAASAGLLEQLRSGLLTLELKRIEMERLFQPTYPALQEVESQIAKVKESIATAERTPLLEETTDRDPTHDFLVTELARARSELAALQARHAATSRSLGMYRAKARRLEHIGRVEQDLARQAKQAEQNYLTYSRKREEARISNALDAQRIVNVAVAEEATIPLEPTGPRRALILFVGVMFAGIFSVSSAFAAENWKSWLRPLVDAHASFKRRAVPADPQPVD